MSTPSASTLPPSLCNVFSSTCPRQQLLTCKIPPVDCNIIVHQISLVEVPTDFVYTSFAALEKRPPACAVKVAVTLTREEKKKANEMSKSIDLEVADNERGVSICQFGVFPRDRLRDLEWLGEVKLLQCSTIRRKWILQTPDNLDTQTRENELSY